MVVRVVTDSGADIPQQIVSDLGITVVPLTVSFGGDSFLDGVDLSAEEFYERLVKEEMMPTTSQPSIGSFVDVYKKIKKSSDQILSIHVSSKLSGTLNSATQAASEEELGESIEFLDSYQASIGLGFAVIAAAKAAKEGASLEGAVAAAKSVLDRTRIFILFHTLKYLEKGGRMGRASALFGSVLQIKPILTLKDGEIVPELKVRTFRKGMLSLQQLVEDCGDLESASILYTTDEEEASSLAGRIGNKFIDDTEPLVIRISPAIGTHGGPGLIGAACVIAKDG